MMKKPILKFLSVLFVTMFIASCGGGGGGNDSSSDGGSAAVLLKILVLGDSIGTGFGSSVGFPIFLEESAGVPLVNKSKDGRSTSQGLGLVGGFITEHNPSHLVVLLGTNDALRENANIAIQNLQSIVNIANAAGVIPIIGTIPPITGKGSEVADRGNKIVAGILELSGARIAGVRGALDSSVHLVDGVHPTTAGQKIIAATFAGQL